MSEVDFDDLLGESTQQASQPQSQQPIQQPKTEQKEVKTEPTKPQTTQNPQPTTSTASTKPKFDYTPEKPDSKIVLTIYGNKGDGKTALALSFEGKISAISFDHKTQRVKDLLYKDRNDIIVYDGVRYYNESSDEAWLQSSQISLDYIYNLLENQIKNDQSDWIILDGMEVFYTMSEMAMRYNNNLKPYEGIQNRNIWKQRRMFMRQVHNLAMRYCKKGVIYTTYTVLQGKIVDADGQLVNAKEVPKWYGVMELETDVTIRTDIKQVKDQRIYTALIENSKISQYISGDERTVTNIGIKAFITKITQQTFQPTQPQQPQKQEQLKTETSTPKPESESKQTESDLF